MPDDRWRRLSYHWRPAPAQCLHFSPVSTGIGSGFRRDASHRVGGGLLRVNYLFGQAAIGFSAARLTIDAPITPTAGASPLNPSPEHPLLLTAGNDLPRGELHANVLSRRAVCAPLQAPLDPTARALRFRIPQAFAGPGFLYLTVAGQHLTTDPIASPSSAAPAAPAHGPPPIRHSRDRAALGPIDVGHVGRRRP